VGLLSLRLAARWPAPWLGTANGQRGLAVLEWGLAVAVAVLPTGLPVAAPVQWTLAFLGVCSGLSRWRHAGAGRHRPGRGPAGAAFAGGRPAAGHAAARRHGRSC
jgi:hypothetical protein